MRRGNCNDQQHDASSRIERGLQPQRGFEPRDDGSVTILCGLLPSYRPFRTEQHAQEHCPRDAVVWVDAQSGTYQLKGQGTYGISATGRYACRSEADGAGMHAMAN